MANVEGWKLMLTAIFAVFVSVALLVLIAWRFGKGAE